MKKFLSTLSLRRATAKPLRKYHTTDISIHALLAESDQQTRKQRHLQRYFYPRSPCGERHNNNYVVTRGNEFLSTLSLRRATESIATLRTVSVISIHALLAESDSKSAQNSGALLRI